MMGAFPDGVKRAARVGLEQAEAIERLAYGMLAALAGDLARLALELALKLVLVARDAPLAGAEASVIG